MPNVDTVLGANRTAVHELIAAAEASESAWTTPTAPEKWSPSQLVEHVARCLEESANVVAGRSSAFPTLPFFLRPVIRAVFFRKVLRKKAFPKSKTMKPLDPASGSASAADGKRRLLTALAGFEEECRSKAASGQAVVSSVFGAVSVEEYGEFQALHTRHHCDQIRQAHPSVTH